MRTTQKLAHTMERKGYPRMAHDMQKIRDDAIARVLGPERRARVRGLGFGATPSRVDAQIQSNRRVRELESQLQTQSERMGTLEEKVEALLKLSQQVNFICNVL
ncbi:Transposase 23 domain-containing protein [Abeliophyllum distichum]|uniref:Transposase 23 domain-containing protein n=1 Tax=Abeliophyllum distichum TaxID=126358 RepID=A0ABD1VY79_9LAMI